MRKALKLTALLLTVALFSSLYAGAETAGTTLTASAQTLSKDETVYANLISTAAPGAFMSLIGSIPHRRDSTSITAATTDITGLSADIAPQVSAMRSSGHCPRPSQAFIIRERWRTPCFLSVSALPMRWTGRR